MITIIDRVILYQRATLLVLFNDSQMNSGLCLRPGGLFCCWYATCSALTTIRRAPVLKSGHLVLWAPTDSSCCCHQVSSWALSTSHRSVMRLNWRFSLTFAWLLPLSMSSIPLEKLIRSELHVLDTVTQMDLTLCDPWGPSRPIVLWSEHWSLSPIPWGLAHYSRLAGVIPLWSMGMRGHGIFPGHEN